MGIKNIEDSKIMKEYCEKRRRVGCINDIKVIIQEMNSDKAGDQAILLGVGALHAMFFGLKYDEDMEINIQKGHNMFIELCKKDPLMTIN